MANNYQPHGLQTQTGFPPDMNLGESQASGVSSQSAQRSSLASTSSAHSQGAEIPEADEDTVDAASFTNQPSIFDLQPQPGKIIAPKLRPRTISESSAGSGGGRDRHPSGPGNKGKTANNNKDGLVSIFHCCKLNSTQTL